MCLFYQHNLIWCHVISFRSQWRNFILCIKAVSLFISYILHNMSKILYIIRSYISGSLVLRISKFLRCDQQVPFDCHQFRSLFITLYQFLFSMIMMTVHIFIKKGFYNSICLFFVVVTHIRNILIILFKFFLFKRDNESKRKGPFSCLGEIRFFDFFFFF